MLRGVDVVRDALDDAVELGGRHHGREQSVPWAEKMGVIRPEKETAHR